MTDKSNSINFGKNNEVRFDNFRTMSKSDFEKARKNNELNDTQKRLADALIKHYKGSKEPMAIDNDKLQILMYQLNDYAKDGNLGKREADKFFKNVLGLEFKRDDLEVVMKYMASHREEVLKIQSELPKLVLENVQKPDEIIPLKVELSPKKEKYAVKQNEVWYNIVKAKYEVNDHNTVMNIVHQLKNENGVHKKDKNMPKVIDLPKNVQVDKKTYRLNIDAETDSSAVAFEKPVQTQVSNNNNVSNVPPKKDSNLPEYDNCASFMSLESINRTGGTTMTEIYAGGSKPKYTFVKDGRQILSYKEHVYDEKGNEVREISRDLKGNVTEYLDRVYDNQNREVQTVYRDKNGILKSYKNIE